MGISSPTPRLRLDIITLFPDMFTPLFLSILKRAQEEGLVQIALHNLRNWGKGKHRSVDDQPYGGGPGMVLMAEPIAQAIRTVKSLATPDAPVIYMTPQGQLLHQSLVEHLASHRRLIILCGHYEGIDERVRENLIDLEVSIGDYVLTGGELPAMVLCDAIIRLVPGVLKEESVRQESFTSGLLDHPHYTRPANWEGKKVPEVLLSGNHTQIAAWRKQAALERTKLRRPDLLPANQHATQKREFPIDKKG